MRKIFLLFYVLILLIINSNLSSQPITWQRVYGSPQPEYGRDGIQTFDGGYIIVAIRLGQEGGTLLVKLDPLGNEEWTRIIDSLGTAVSIKQTADSNFIIAGGVNSKGMLIKTDKFGNLIWKKFYSINNEGSSFRKVKVINNETYVMCGITSFPPKAYIMKTDSGGAVVWQKSFLNNSYTANAYDIIESADNYFYLTGLTLVNGFPKTLIGKMSSKGDLIWTKSYGTEGKGDAQSSVSIVSESNTELFLTGHYSDFYSSEAHFTKIDSSGNLIFQNVLPQTNESNSMCKTSTGNFAIAGGIATTSDDILFLLLNRSGNIISRKVFNSGGIEGDFSESIIQTKDNGFLITGYTSYLNTSQLDYNIYVIKTDSIGNAPPVSIQNSNNEIPARFKLYQNYPNPFNAQTKINFEVSRSDYIQIIIYDLTGKVMSTVINEYYNPGIYEVRVDGANLSSGIYFYSLISGSYSETRKMFQIK